MMAFQSFSQFSDRLNIYNTMQDTGLLLCQSTSSLSPVKGFADFDRNATLRPAQHPQTTERTVEMAISSAKQSSFSMLRKIQMNPFPTLEKCSRSDIFEVIYLLEEDSQALKDQITKEQSGCDLQELKRTSKRHQFKINAGNLHLSTLLAVEEQLKEKEKERDRLEADNVKLERENATLLERFQQIQQQLISKGEERRMIEVDFRIQEDQHHSLELSRIFSNLYHDIKGTPFEFQSPNTH